jgi:hypothetical protein
MCENRASCGTGGGRMAASRLSGRLGEVRTDATSPARDREKLATDGGTMGLDG